MYNIFAIICFLKKEKLILVQNSIEHTADAVGIVAMTTCLFETWLSNTASVTPPPVFGTWQVVSGNACKTLKCRNKLNQELLTAFAATGYCAVLCLLFTGFKTFYVVLCHYVENGFVGCCIFASVNKRNRVGSTYGGCTFSTRSALGKVWRTTSDHRVLNVHNSNKPHDSILQSTKTLNATNNENYGKRKQQLADARTFR